MCSDRARALAALTLAALWACGPSSGSHALPAAIDAVEPVCGDTVGPTPVVLRGTFPVLPRVSLQDPDRTELDTTYRAWLGDVELLQVAWRDPHSLTATVPASMPAGVYPLTVESPFRERVTGHDGFEVREGGCSGPPGALAITATAAPNAVTVGQQVTVTAAVRNTGQRPVLDVEALVTSAPAGAVLVSGPSPDPELRGGEVATFVWTYSTTQTTGAEGATFAIVAAGVDELGAPVTAPQAATNPVLVNLPANVTAHTHAPIRVNVGQAIAFALDVANTGAAPASVVAAISTDSACPVTRLSSPPLQNVVPALSERSLVWNLSASAPCQIGISVDLSATDLNSGQSLTVAPTPPVTVAVQLAAVLVTAVDAAPVVPATQTVTVTATVRNTGQATASAVGASVFAAPALFTVVTSPAGPLTIDGGSSVTFAWSYRANPGASVGTFAIDAAGFDANSSSSVVAARAVSGQVAVAYAVGGTVSGLTRSGLVLRNGVENLAVAGDGPFGFLTPVASGAPYAVTVAEQPRGQTCAVADGEGTVLAAHVTAVRVTCARDTHTLATAVSPDGAGTLTCGGSGCLASYPFSTDPMEIVATPAPGFAFDAWSGDCTGAGACFVTMEANRSVTAHFSPVSYALVASASPAGSGTLTCGGSACLASYGYSTAPMEIVATPGPGWAFSSWSGDCTGAGACFVTMEANRTVTAHFTAVSFALAVSASPAGAGTLSCGGATCLASYGYSTAPMEIVATPNPGWAFASWSGDCTGTGACFVTMSGDRAVTAHFTPVSWAFVAIVSPLGAGTLSCGGATCLPSYPHSTEPMEIEVAAEVGFTFSRWSGDCNGAGRCFVTMTADRTVVAELATAGQN